MSQCTPSTTIICIYNKQQKKKKFLPFGARNVTQVVEHLLSKCQALGSRSPTLPRKSKKFFHQMEGVHHFCSQFIG
jgi:hypothetical protein